MTVYAMAERTNAGLMQDCATLGYLPGSVLDMTYGLGAFWRTYKPAVLTKVDLYPRAEDADVIKADATCLPFDDNYFDTAVFDPPYKLNGTSTGEGASAADARYGVDGGYVPAETRHDLLMEGTLEGLRVARRYVLVKCMDQISSGRYNPQTFRVWQCAMEAGATIVDLLHVGGYREQPYGTRQVHARRNYSTLLVLQP